VKTCRSTLSHHIDNGKVCFEDRIAPATKNTFIMCYPSDEENGDDFLFGEICLSDGPGFENGDVCFYPGNMGAIGVDILEKIVDKMKENKQIKEKMQDVKCGCLFLQRNMEQNEVDV